MARKIKCPRFGCNGIGYPVSTNKKFSVGKAVVGNTIGGLLAGGLGAVVGTAAGINGKNGKTTFVCNKCGRTFQAKI